MAKNRPRIPNRPRPPNIQTKSRRPFCREPYDHVKPTEDGPERAKKNREDARENPARKGIYHRGRTCKYTGNPEQSALYGNRPFQCLS